MHEPALRRLPLPLRLRPGAPRPLDGGFVVPLTHTEAYPIGDLATHLRADGLSLEELPYPRLPRVLALNHGGPALLPRGAVLRGGIADRVVTRSTLVGPRSACPVPVWAIERRARFHEGGAGASGGVDPFPDPYLRTTAAVGDDEVVARQHLLAYPAGWRLPEGAPWLMPSAARLHLDPSAGVPSGVTDADGQDEARAILDRGHRVSRRITDAATAIFGRDGAPLAPEEARADGVALVLHDEVQLHAFPDRAHLRAAWPAIRAAAPMVGRGDRGGHRQAALRGPRPADLENRAQPESTARRVVLSLDRLRDAPWTPVGASGAATLWRDWGGDGQALVWRGAAVHVQAVYRG